MKIGQLYTLKDEELKDWVEVTKCLLEKVVLSLSFMEVSLRVMEALRVKHLLRRTTQVVEDDENGEFLTRELFFFRLHVFVSFFERDQ